MKVRNYRELIAWQKAMDYVADIYRLSARFPKEELYGLTSQLRRCAVSVPSNIAEGQGRQSTRDFVNFLSTAYGSLNESQTQVLIAQMLGYISDQQAEEVLGQSHEVARLINGLSNSLSSKLSTTH